ncbi:MAG: DUF91 domain-containing protein [Rhodoferax sp.]|jgi:RecB family endonuclease NucS|nr:DUF91 domain-containing protein [Rhodoferax sp.]
MPVTLSQREHIVKLLRESILSTEEIAEVSGVPRGSVIAIKAHLGMGRYEIDTATKEIIEEAAELKFGLERDMEQALRSNIQQLEPGLKISDGGKQRITDAGYIDITATDESGATVIIELKAGIAEPQALTQLLAYIGAVGQEGGLASRGLLIAQNFHPKLLFAVKAVSNVKLLKYNFKFGFQSV